MSILGFCHRVIILICVYVLIAVLAFAAAPVVSNVVVTPVTGQVNISYDLEADDACKITVLVSNDNGASYKIIPTALSGTGYGDQITSGTGKQIIWQPGAETPVIELGSNYKLRVIARDNPTQNEHQFASFVKLEGGTFNNGTSDVTLSTFFIDKYEITQSDYEAVMGTNPSYFTGVTNGPVEQVSWFNAIEYCNRRSLQEGLTPCYSYSTDGSNTSDWPAGWNIIWQNHTNVSCNWTVNGYRLPTEMEWMFAAKGGNQSQGYTYSGSNDLNAVGWYRDNSGRTTHPVGTKAANELGIFDMSGNVCEFVWDIYGIYPSGPQTDPHGVTSGYYRVKRGGSMIGIAVFCTVSSISFAGATLIDNDLGFRCVRVSP